MLIVLLKRGMIFIITLKDGSCPMLIELKSLHTAEVVMLSQQLPATAVQLIEPSLQQEYSLLTAAAVQLRDQVCSNGIA